MGGSIMKVHIQVIGSVTASRTEAIDDFWGGQRATITLTDHFPADALWGLDEFSHVEVLFLFHKVNPDGIVTAARHPRNNKAWPKVGIFAQRGKNRPNRLGSTICPLIAVEGRQIHVAELDAIDGTPVIDIKPVMKEFLPRSPVHQPDWSRDLMREYWRGADT